MPMSFPFSISIPGLNHLPDDVKAEIVLQGLQLAGTLIILLLSWLIGQRIIAYWEIKRRIRESDLESERIFQKLHGEFKALWRLWKAYVKGLPENVEPSISIQEPLLWDLMSRASQLEGECEALLLNLASNRDLSAHDLNQLGQLRQLIQQLREGMKRGQRLNEDFRRADYQLFHSLSAQVLALLRRPSKAQSVEQTDANMKTILAVKSVDLSSRNKM